MINLAFLFGYALGFFALALFLFLFVSSFKMRLLLWIVY